MIASPAPRTRQIARIVGIVCASGERERGCAEECETRGECDAIAEASDDARRRELGGDGGEHERAGREPRADAARADRCRVLRNDGEEQIKTDHRQEAGGAQQDHRPREQRRALGGVGRHEVWLDGLSMLSERSPLLLMVTVCS